MFYILADDLSGALETGAAFRAHGFRVLLPLREGGLATEPDEGIVHVLSTETRNAPADVARAIITRILATQQAAGTRLLFKKIDSTMRGPIGAGLAAIERELSPPLIVVCPANPRVGRTVRNGVLHVGGVPLEQTDFRNDPLWPASTGDVATLLARSGGSPAVRLTREDLRSPDALYSKLGSARNAVTAIADAETMEDLHLIVTRVTAAIPGTVFVGSGALGLALAQSIARSCAPVASLVPPARSVVVLCGSRHPASHRQLDHLAACGWPLIESDVTKGRYHDVAVEIAAHLAQHSRVAVRFGHAGSPASNKAREVIRMIEMVSSSLLWICRPDALMLTGGETAWAVCQVLAGDVLEVLGELEPGVAMARMPVAEGEITIVTKPGGYGQPATLHACALKLIGVIS